jgi:hypothetical protein
VIRTSRPLRVHAGKQHFIDQVQFVGSDWSDFLIEELDVSLVRQHQRGDPVFDDNIRA